MRITSEIKSPNYFMSAPYEAGQMIDFSEAPEETDLDKTRAELAKSLQDEQLPIDQVVSSANEYLMSVGITHRADDLEKSLSTFTGRPGSTEEMIADTYKMLFSPDEKTPREKLMRILDATHILGKPPHIPVQVYSHIPGETTNLGANGTHFGYVLNDDEQNAAQTQDGREYPLYPNTVFSFPQAVDISGKSRMRIFTAVDQDGLLSLSGDIGDWGRQNYIDGCTSTLLISPVMKGEACMNSLYFPEGVEQTQHTHPSIRAGIVSDGEGICKTPVGDIPLQPGNSFFLPPETWHSFHTQPGKTLSVVAFHPDSDFGPTHEDHPMLNRTHFEFLHKLKSVLRTSK